MHRLASVFAACLLTSFVVSCSSTAIKIKTYGLMDSAVVCTTCSPANLHAKTVGIMRAMRVMIQQIGDIRPRNGKITFHLDMDKTCSDALKRLKKMGGTLETMGFVQCEKVNGVPDTCDVCLDGHTKQNLETAKSLAGQVLPIHEAGHVWWKGREDLYNAEEPLVQMLSYTLSGNVNYCTKYTWSGIPLSLVGDLCQRGITKNQIIQIYTSCADRADRLGRPLTEEELVRIVSSVVEQDMRPSFIDAGIITSGT